ncbi:SMI1/KNR4 family protein [Streptomyces cinnamoneus]|uniref:SMI1/KNR4 family protein n=1 Tax=Streptomyces cinnamoneus TaxID=53446 RepID=UPI00378979EB
MALSHGLASLLGRPQVNGDVDQDWEEFERSVGMSLPEDYKEFISAYGPCCLNDNLLLFHPRGETGDQGLNLGEFLEDVADVYECLKEEDPDEYPYLIYPERGGFFPVGRTSSGNHLFLRPPQPDVESWGIVIHIGEWEFLDMSFTEFLSLGLSGELFVPLFDGEPTFEVVGSVVDS